MEKTSLYRYRENINAGYFQLSKTFGGFVIKPGLRLETTFMEGTMQLPYDTAFTIKRTDLFPYIYLKQRLMKVFGMEINGNLILKRSISRPGYGSLNPAPVYVDQFLYNIGNPQLRPQFTNNYEFNLTADQYPFFSAGINDVKNVFTSVTYQNDDTNIIYNTYDNLGKNKEYYLRALAGIPPRGNYFFFTGTQFNYSHYRGFYQQQPIDYTNVTWMFFMYQSYKFHKGTKISAFGFYRMNSLVNFYELGPFGMVNLNITQPILKSKANIILSATDIFKTMQMDFKLNQANIHARGSRYSDNRRVTLKFIYNFGFKPKQEEKGFQLPNEGI